MIVKFIDVELIARRHLGSQIRIRYCSGENIPRTFYNFHDDEHYIFQAEDPHNLKIGATRYVAVSKVTGGFRDLGFVGE